MDTKLTASLKPTGFKAIHKDKRTHIIVEEVCNSVAVHVPALQLVILIITDAHFRHLFKRVFQRILCMFVLQSFQHVIRQNTANDRL